MERFETKYDLLNAAYRDPELKKGTVALLQYLVHKSNKEQCFPSVDTIAKALGVCRRTVQYNMRKLERAGYIIRKDRYYNHLQMTNQYIFYFGITEDKPGQIRYSNEEYKVLNDVSMHIPDRQIRKVDEIQKIYNMELTAGEKLLMVYLYHRANKKGVVYDSVPAFMRAVGVRSRTLQRILKSLRDKGLIHVKKAILHDRVYLAVQLTGKIYHAEEKEDDCSASVADNQGGDAMAEGLVGRFIQSSPFDQKQKNREVIHNRQTRILEYVKKLRKRRVGKAGYQQRKQYVRRNGINRQNDNVYMRIRKRLYENNLFRIFTSVHKAKFEHMRKKVKEILRI